MKALASGGTRGTVLAEDAVFIAQRPRWLADGHSVIYLSSDGLKQVSAEGGAAHLVSRERPALWDTSPDSRVVYAVIEREHRAIDLVAIDIATGASRTITPVGRRPVRPEYFN